MPLSVILMSLGDPRPRRNIRAKSLFFIRTLTNLRSLNLSNTGITALSLRHLYRALVGLKVSKRLDLDSDNGLAVRFLHQPSRTCGRCLSTDAL